MKVELIESIDIDDLIEEEFYSKPIITSPQRRDFLKYCAVGTAGILLPLSNPEKAYAMPPLVAAALIEASVEMIKLLYDYWKAHDYLEGDVWLINEKRHNVKGNVQFGLINEANNHLLGSASSDYKVPKRKIQQYRFENGPQANVREDTTASLIAETKFGSKGQNGIFISA